MQNVIGLDGNTVEVSDDTPVEVIGSLSYLLTPERVAELKTQREVWENNPSWEMEQIREHRNGLLAETDWMALPDVTMSDAWKTYRQELRDIPASNTVYENVTWPPKPE